MYLSGVSSINLAYILDFIYYGEVKLFQEQLNDFIESAQILEIEGLLGNKEDQEHQEKVWQHDIEHEYLEHNTEHTIDTQNDKKLAKIENDLVKPRNHNIGLPSNKDAVRFDVGSMSAEEIEIKKNELFEQTAGVWSCLACTYTSNHTSNIKKHVETHLDGLCYNCTLCNKEFRSKNSLTKHRYSIHKSSFQD